MTEENTIPVTRLDLSQLPPAERFPAWQESIGVMFSADWSPSGPEAGFNAQVAAGHLGQLLIGEASSCAQRFNRTPSMIRRDGLDHCLLQVYLHGTTRGRWGAHRSSASQVGDVLFLDLAQPFASSTQDFRNLNLVLPRSVLVPKLGAPERLHGCLLSRESVLGRVLGEHLQSLWLAANQATVADAQAMARGLVELIGAYYRDSPVRALQGHPQVALALRESIRSYIERHLGQGDLSPEQLAVQFHISRSHLFALFKPLGGVAGYIRRRRLVRAYALLSQPQPGCQVTGVSLAVGFVNAAHFSRAFREAFGLSPREVLEEGRQCIPHATSAAPLNLDRRYEHWLRELL